MSWDFFSTIIAAVALILTIFLDWPRFKARFRESIVENNNFQRLVDILSVILFYGAMIFVFVIGESPTLDKNSPFWIFIACLLMGLGGIRMARMLEDNRLLIFSGLLTFIGGVGLLVLAVVL